MCRPEDDLRCCSSGLNHVLPCLTCFCTVVVLNGFWVSNSGPCTCKQALYQPRHVPRPICLFITNGWGENKASKEVDASFLPCLTCLVSVLEWLGSHSGSGGQVECWNCLEPRQASKLSLGKKGLLLGGSGRGGQPPPWIQSLLVVISNEDFYDCKKIFLNQSQCFQSKSSFVPSFMH